MFALIAQLAKGGLSCLERFLSQLVSFSLVMFSRYYFLGKAALGLG